MKWFFGALLLVFCSACGPAAACRSLAIGTPIADLRKTKLEGASYGGRSDVASRATPNTSDFDVGAVENHLCCYSKSINRKYGFEWCTEAQLECTDSAFQGVELYSLREPFYESIDYDAGQFCVVAAKDGLIVAIWSRYWS